MKRSAFRKRVIALRERLADIVPDAVWIVQPENRRYLSGFRATDMQLTESSGSLLINKRKALLVTDSRYTTEAEKEAPDFKVVLQRKGVVETMVPLLARFRARTLGFEEDFVTYGLHQQLARALKKPSPPVRLNRLKGLVDEMREVKEGAEIKAIEASANLMSQILGIQVPEPLPAIHFTKPTHNLPPSSTTKSVAVTFMILT